MLYVLNGEKMKNVLIVMSTLYNGGAEKSLVNFLNELPSDKYNVDLLLFEKKGIFLKQVPEYINLLETPKRIRQLYHKDLRKAGGMLPVKVVGSLVSKISTQGESEMRAFRWKHFYSKFISKLEKHYDVAFAYISADIMRFVVDKVNADKKIVTIHNDYIAAKYSRKDDYSYLEKIDTITSISDTCVDILKKVFPEFKEKIVCLPNITSSTILRKRAEEFFPQEYEKDVINILSIGRLSEQKGFDIAIKAAKILKQNGQSFKWFIIGTGELQNELSELINENDLEMNFILLGARENPYPYIKNCSIFVQPSRFEGKSVVLDEAKILACPIIATNYPTVKDQLQEGVEGMIVPMDAEGISKGILSVIDKTYDMENCKKYLQEHEFGNQKDIELYYKII